LGSFDRFVKDKTTPKKIAQSPQSITADRLEVPTDSCAALLVPVATR
jgi:hypothetical protein